MNPAVLSKASFAALAKKYKMTESFQGDEVIFFRTHSEVAEIRMFVYSALSRRTGLVKDQPIRVAVKYDATWMAYHKIARVGTSDKVMAVVEEKLRASAEEVAKMLKVRCKVCSAPTYADSRKCIVKECREKQYGPPKKKYTPAAPGATAKFPPGTSAAFKRKLDAADPSPNRYKTDEEIEAEMEAAYLDAQAGMGEALADELGGPDASPFDP